MVRAFFIVLSALLLTFSVGCSSYVDGFYYAPHPAVAEIFPGPMQGPATQPQNPLNPLNAVPHSPAPGAGQPQAAPQEPPLVSAFATVVGVYRGDSKAGIPLSVEVRIRLVNHAAHSAEFDPQSLEMVDGELLKFQPPIIRPSQPVNLVPNQATILHAWFPFPQGTSYDHAELGSLQLRWTVMVDGRAVEQMAAFHRVQPRYYYDPYWGYPAYCPYPVFGGVFVYRHRW